MKIISKLPLLACVALAFGCRAANQNDEKNADASEKSKASPKVVEHNEDADKDANRVMGKTPVAEQKPGEKIYFNTDSANLSASSSEPLSEMCEWLKENPKRDAVIHGYADDRGAATANKALGKERASAVRDSLVKCGAKADRITVVSHGEKGPELSNSKERRVVFVADES